MAHVELSSSVHGKVEVDFWRGRRVLITGHTGFKGAWLAIWLQLLGAQVIGLSNGVPTEPSLYELAQIGDGMDTEFTVDVRDFDALSAAVARSRPEIVIHMAAQSLVRRSFADPRETFETNVMGTVNVLEAVRHAGESRVVINVTSDKCYENRELEWGYREDDPMGGFDPYSSSKGCAELVTAAFRRAFFEPDPAGPRVASVRAGNVIGGGDWGEDRLLPDVMRAALDGRQVHVRNPAAIRPWQHVLNPLSGYLVLAQALWESREFATAWNFGPPDDESRPVRWVVEQLHLRWPGELRWEYDTAAHPHEAHHLKLDSSRARTRLGWRPAWNLQEALDRIVDWYGAFANGADVRAATRDQVEAFAAVQAAGPGSAGV